MGLSSPWIFPRVNDPNVHLTCARKIHNTLLRYADEQINFDAAMILVAFEEGILDKWVRATIEGNCYYFSIEPLSERFTSTKPLFLTKKRPIED